MSFSFSRYFGKIEILVFELNPISSLFKKEGISICDNDEQSENADCPIWVTEEGIEICVNDEHLKNA